MAESRRQLINASSFFQREEGKFGGFSAKKSTISGSSFKKGSSLGNVVGQESDVGKLSRILRDTRGKTLVNEKKITLLKKVSNLRKDNQQEKVNSPLLESLQAIAATTDSIRDTLIQKQDFDEDIREDMRIAGEKADADKQEKGLENTKPKPLTKLGEKIIAPVTSIFGKIFNFIKTLILGKFLMNFIDWFANPANQGKIQSFVRFIKDWWPALTAAVLLFGTGFTTLVAGLMKVIVWGVAKLLGLIPLLKAALLKLRGGKLLSMIPGGKWVKGGLLLGGTALTAWGVNKVMSNDEGMGEDSEEFQEFNKGGQVPGSGPNKDTVPAMLTPGEFVMTRGAVQKYGTDTLEGMNAAAGGTNQSTFSKGKSGFNEGGKAIDKSHYGTEGYRIGQVNPPKLIVSQEKYTSKYSEKGGEVIDEHEDYSEMIAAIDKRDLIEHQKQLVGEIRKVPGYENINIMEVIDRDVNMPLDQYLPILMNSDAQAATFARMDEARAMDMQSRGITDPSKGYSMSLNDGGLVQHLNGGGLVQGFQGGGQVQDYWDWERGFQKKVTDSLKQKDPRKGTKEGDKIRREIAKIRPSERTEQNVLDYIALGGNASRSNFSIAALKNRKKIEFGLVKKSSAKVQSTKPKDSSKSGGFMEGLKRVMGGTADQLTGNLFDFDKKSGGGLIRKTAGAVGGLFGGGKKEGGSKGGSKGGSSGILGPISSNVDAMVNTDKYEVKPKEKKNTVVAYEQAVNEQQQQNQQGEGGGNEIPQFTLRPSFMIDPAKVDVLGIVV